MAAAAAVASDGVGDGGGVAAELLELYRGEGMLHEALGLLFSHESPIGAARQATLSTVVLRLQQTFRRRKRSATVLAAAERGRLARTEVRRTRSATRLAAAWRGHHARDEVKHVRLRKARTAAAPRLAHALLNSVGMTVDEEQQESC